MCQVSGYCGMPTLKLRPKSMSMHGRQYVQVGGEGGGKAGAGEGLAGGGGLQHRKQ